MDIGNTLRDARQRQGLTLQEISRATKISIHVLEAIEHNDLAAVPRGVFIRGYLRAYARQVGLNPAQIVGEYLAQHEAPPEDEELEELRIRYANRGSGRSPRSDVVIVMAGLAVLLYSLFFSRPDRPAVSDPAVDTARVIDARVPSTDFPVAPAHVTAVPLAADAMQAADISGLTLEIQPEGLCWVSAVTDGRRALYRLMKPGERAVLEARELILMRVGDAGAFGYWINGVEGRPIGLPGEAVTLEITADNYQTFLASYSDPPAL